MDGTNRMLVVEAERCTGCGLCEMACSLQHQGVCSPALSRQFAHDTHRSPASAIQFKANVIAVLDVSRHSFFFIHPFVFEGHGLVLVIVSTQLLDVGHLQ